MAVAALIVGVGAAQFLTAQTPQSGEIAGRLTDLQSIPVDGAEVTVRNEATGAEARTATQKNGSFSFSGLDAGTYTVVAESKQLGRGMLEGIYVTPGHETHVRAAMEFELAPPEPARAAVHEIEPVATAVSSGAKARDESVDPMRGLKPPPPSVSGLSTAKTRINPGPTGRTSSSAVGTEQTSPRGERRAASQIARPAVKQNLAVVKAKATGAVPVPSVDKPTAASATPIPSVVKPKESSAKLLPIAPEQKAITRTLPAGWSLAISEAAAGVVQGAAELSQTRPKRAQVAHQNADPVTPVVTTKLSGAELQALPASGRRWQDFVLDTPAAATVAGGRTQASLRGAGQEPAETTIDGANFRLAFGGQGGYGPGSSGPGSNGQGGREQNGMAQAWAGGRGAQVAEAAIREVEMAAGNAEAEGARTAGGRVNVETIGGANGLHGQGFVFDRQNTWGAQNPFTQWVKETTPANGSTVPVPVFTPESYTPPDHETVWGVGLGSQIRRNKMFWFAALDSYRRNDPGLAMVKHPYLVEPVSGCTIGPCTETTGFFEQPTNDQMQALSSRLGLSPSNPIAEGLAAYSGMLETLGGLLGPAPRTAAQWVGFARLDWQAAERHHFTLEAIGADWDSPGGGLTRVSETYGNHSFGSSEASEELLLGRWEAFITPNLLMVTQGSAGHDLMSAHAETPSAYEQTLLAGNTWGQLPQIVVDSRYGFTIGNPSRLGPAVIRMSGCSRRRRSWTGCTRQFAVKSGFEIGHNEDAIGVLRNQTGTYNYSSVENFASDALVFAEYGIGGELNPMTSTTATRRGRCGEIQAELARAGALPCYSYYSQTMGPTEWNLSTNDWAVCTTAQWQPRKHLMVSAGLRWEREQLPPPIAATGRAGCAEFAE